MIVLPKTLPRPGHLCRYLGTSQPVQNPWIGNPINRKVDIFLRNYNLLCKANRFVWQAPHSSRKEPGIGTNQPKVDGTTSNPKGIKEARRLSELLVKSVNYLMFYIILCFYGFESSFTYNNNDAIMIPSVAEISVAASTLACGVRSVRAKRTRNPGRVMGANRGEHWRSRRGFDS